MSQVWVRCVRAGLGGTVSGKADGTRAEDALTQRQSPVGPRRCAPKLFLSSLRLVFRRPPHRPLAGLLLQHAEKKVFFLSYITLEQIGRPNFELFFFYCFCKGRWRQLTTPSLRPWLKLPTNFAQGRRLKVWIHLFYIYLAYYFLVLLSRFTFNLSCQKLKEEALIFSVAGKWPKLPACSYRGRLD